MNLNFDNCVLKIDEKSINCEYLFILNKEIKWEIELNEDGIKYLENKKKIFLASNEIKKFLFEVNQGIQRGHNLSNVGVGYVKINSQIEPIELFKICVREELKQVSKTKSYEFSEIIIKKISSFYNKPYEYKTFIDTTKKRNKTNKLVSFIFLVIIINIILFLIFKK